jgi:hypothetical protein
MRRESLTTASGDRRTFDDMGHVRFVQAPVQEGVRVVVLGVDLWTDHLVLHTRVESDQKEIDEPFWEEDQVDMFAVLDDLGTGYRRASAGGSGNPEEHIWTYRIKFYPAVPDAVTALTITHIAGGVDVPL